MGKILSLTLLRIGLKKMDNQLTNTLIHCLLLLQKGQKISSRHI